MEEFQPRRSSVWKIWHILHQPQALITQIPPVTRRENWSPSEVASAIQTVPLCQRQTLRALARETGIPN
uniref:Uncharacterized protein n=1 Tax=Hyaloperonospora arabidopsidis (strain Emoy2) TaxID=559515 RepID=M4BJP7_HYAAE